MKKGLLDKWLGKINPFKWFDDLSASAGELVQALKDLNSSMQHMADSQWDWIANNGPKPASLYAEFERDGKTYAVEYAATSWKVKEQANE